MGVVWSVQIVYLTIPELLMYNSGIVKLKATPKPQLYKALSVLIKFYCIYYNFTIFK
jgi:hypothetical protein